jgi:DNA-binding protein HU-beta
MNRSELIQAVAQRSAVSPAAVDQVLAGLNSVVAQQLVTGDRVTLPGFITFEVIDRAARTGRNPKTGDVLEIPAKRVVKMTVGQALKRAVADC